MDVLIVQKNAKKAYGQYYNFEEEINLNDWVYVTLHMKRGLTAIFKKRI